jgi:hypothetical protein
MEAPVAIPATTLSEESIFLSRAINAVVSLQKNLSKQNLAAAANASSDYMVLVNALTSAPIPFEFALDDPLAAAKLRGVEQMKQLIEAGGSVLRASEVADLLGLTRQAVDKRRTQNRLIGLTQGRRGYAYPRFQFAESRALAGLEDVLGALPDADPTGQLIFFVNPNDFLDGETPADALRQGRIDEVVRAARTAGEQGAR